MNRHYVYILCSKSKRLKIGYTEDITGMLEEKSKTHSRSLQKFNRLIYYEKRPTKLSARKRVEKIEGMPTSDRNELISKFNPEWLDVSFIWQTKSKEIFDF